MLFWIPDGSRCSRCFWYVECIRRIHRQIKRHINELNQYTEHNTYYIITSYFVLIYGWNGFFLCSNFHAIFRMAFVHFDFRFSRYDVRCSCWNVRFIFLFPFCFAIPFSCRFTMSNSFNTAEWKMEFLFHFMTSRHAHFNIQHANRSNWFLDLLTWFSVLG